MDLQDVANLAVVLGVPLTILGLIIAYRALKSQINTIGTQINTNFDTITLQIKHINPVQYNTFYITNNSLEGQPLTHKQINQIYIKGIEEKGKDD